MGTIFLFIINKYLIQLQIYSLLFLITTEKLKFIWYVYNVA